MQSAPMSFLTSILTAVLARYMLAELSSRTRHLIEAHPIYEPASLASNNNRTASRQPHDYVTSDSEFDRVLLRLQDLAYHTDNPSQSQPNTTPSELQTSRVDSRANNPASARDLATIFEMRGGPQSEWVRRVYGHYGEIKPTTTTTTIRPVAYVAPASGRFSLDDYLPDDMSAEDIMSMIERRERADQSSSSPVRNESGERSDEDECPICLDAGNSRDCIRLDCNHKFHRSCLERWYRESRSYLCPICRRGMRLNGVAFETTLSSSRPSSYSSTLQPREPNVIRDY